MRFGDEIWEIRNFPGNSYISVGVCGSKKNSVFHRKKLK